MTSGYEGRVRGILSARLLETLCTELELDTDTVLVEPIEDQAALHGLLARIREAGIELVDERQVHRSTWIG